VRLVSALANFWFLHGHYAQGRRWLDAAFERSANAPPAVLAKALVGAGMLARLQGEPAAARAYFERSLRVSREAGDTARIAWASLNVATMVMIQGDPQAARAYAEETLASATASGLDQVAASTFILLGEISRLEGDWAAARSFNEQSLAINRRTGHQEGVSVALNNMGAALCELGDVRAADDCYREALTICRALGTPDDMACSLDGLAALAAVRGEWARAGRLAGAAEALREEIGSKIEPADRAMRERYLGGVRERVGEAALEAAMAEGRAMTRDRAIEDALRAE
jgi:non-specific serine/threonine protein kinase